MGKTRTIFYILAVGILFLAATSLLQAKSNDLNSTSPQTLDEKYQTVADEIRAFMQKQSKEHNTTIQIADTNTTQVVTDKHKLDENQSIVPQQPTKFTVIESNTTATPQTNTVKKHVKKEPAAPMLAIIMDDIGFCRQADSIKALGFPITPSIFPPNDHYPDTPHIASRFKHHMIHFPLEAFDYPNLKEKALKVNDSLQSIEKRIKRLKKNFPNMLAINNHTGSKFTCNFAAMDRFFTVLNKYEIPFIDSRTAAESKCYEVGKIHNKVVLQRDVFLDNEANITYIHNQLREAVRIAKRKGSAIAICHPRDDTFKALQSAKEILKGVKLVYINELM